MGIIIECEIHCLPCFAEFPDTSFTRSISNPEAVMRRRRQQKLEKKLQQFRSKDGGPDTGGTLKIYGEALCRDVPYKVSSSMSEGTFSPHIFPNVSDLKQKCTQLLTPFSRMVFHAFSHGGIHFARSVSFENQLIGSI